MSSQAFSLEIESFVPKQQPVVVQVQELPISSPVDELPSKSVSAEPVLLVDQFGDGVFDGPRDWNQATIMKSSDPWCEAVPTHETATYHENIDEKEMVEYQDLIKRRPTMRLPAFHPVEWASPPRRYLDGRLTGHAELAWAGTFDSLASPSASHQRCPDMSRCSQSLSWPLASRESSSLAPYYGCRPPLLTPPEDVDSFDWGAFPKTEPRFRTAADSHTHDSRAQSQFRPSPSSRPSEIQMPLPASLPTDDNGLGNWLGRASNHLVSHINDSFAQGQIQMVVQALPSQAKHTASKPTFEKIVELVQAQFVLSPYITITHAVSQVISMDEVPASPPATPSTTYTSDDYFQNQTIFTHAAVVPAYHSLTQSSGVLSQRPTSIIAAPSSIHITTLERYIPPTTPQEVDDFFSLSRKSYLSDRLLELSANNGSLLLVYPTKAGAMTFANKYVGPVIEPFLRQFIILNDLFSHVASSLGRLASLDNMKSFEELETAVQAMCRTLGQRAPARGLHTRYDLVHAETAGVVLERAVWKEWFLDQEQPRLRQNLVDYHKAGGRMPTRAARVEVTPTMLAREVVEGIRSSREPAGDVEIEVGVFVIRRSIV